MSSTPSPGTCLGCEFGHQVTGRGTHVRQSISVSLSQCVSLPPSTSLSLKSINIFSNEHLLKSKFLSIFYLLCYHSCPIFSSPLSLSASYQHSLQHSPLFRSCPWHVYVSSLASPFPILFLTLPCLFCTYQLCFLLPVTFPPFSFLHLPTDNPPCDLHFWDFVPVLVVCLVHFWFFLFGC